MTLRQISDALLTMFFVSLFYYLFSGAGWLLAGIGAAGATFLLLWVTRPSEPTFPPR